MGNYKLIEDGKSRLRTFQTREKGLKKKLSELCTLCDVKACMIVYGPDVDGTRSSRPRFWPENPTEVECIINDYMGKRQQESGKRSSNLSDVLAIGKQRADIKPPMLQEKLCQKKRPTLSGGLELEKFSYEELMEIIGKLDKKLEEVDQMIALKKAETNSMSESAVHCSDTRGSSGIGQPLDSHVPIQSIPCVDSDILDDDLHSL